jgi:hypothetical protein
LAQNNLALPIAGSRREARGVCARAAGRMEMNSHDSRRYNDGMRNHQPGRLVFLSLIVVVVASLAGALSLVFFVATRH